MPYHSAYFAFMIIVGADVLGLKEVKKSNPLLS